MAAEAEWGAGPEAWGHVLPAQGCTDRGWAGLLQGAAPLGPMLCILWEGGLPQRWGPWQSTSSPVGLTLGWLPAGHFWGRITLKHLCAEATMWCPGEGTQIAGSDAALGLP